jgi:hypothetical protein
MVEQPTVGDAFGVPLAQHREAVNFVERGNGFIDAAGAGQYFDLACFVKVSGWRPADVLDDTPSYPAVLV